MALKDEINLIVQEYKRLIGQGGAQLRDVSQYNPERSAISSSYGVLEHNRVLFDIFEGDLMTYVLADLKAQLSDKSYEQIKHRAAPINILKRMVDKLSKIYAKTPVRDVKGGVDKDKELIDWYAEEFDLNTNMSMCNEFFNLFKNCALEPYLENGHPRLRVIPSDRFFVYSNDPISPTKPTHFVKIMGKFNLLDQTGKETQRTLLYVYTDKEFLAIDETGGIVKDIMQRLNNPNGVNPFGRIPFVYINRSKHEIIPKKDTDTLAMTKLIPVLLSDLNYAVMFQCFSIIYGVDLDQEGLAIAPNAFWSFKSDPNKEGKPSVGVIKPEVDTDKVIQLIQTQLSFWLTSRSIKPGAMGMLTTENMSSGIAKAIDEMDTSEDRQKQVPFFKQAERDLFDLVIKVLHPIWMGEADFGKKMAFSPGVSVSTTFAEQKPLHDPSQQIDDVIKKVEARLQSREGALRELYPDWTDEQIDEKLSEIDEENTVNLNVVPLPVIPGQKPGQQMPGQTGMQPAAGMPQNSPEEAHEVGPESVEGD